MADDRAQLRAAIAAEFQRLDAHEWGYDHGFSADVDNDPETASFVDAALAVVQAELDKARKQTETAREAALQRAMQLEEARDLFTAAGINRAHGDDWPDIIPALQELITERDEARQQLAAAGLAPVPQPPGAQVLECSAVLFRTFGGTGGHRSHTWEPQPGMVPVWCPGNTASKETSS